MFDQRATQAKQQNNLMDFFNFLALTVLSQRIRYFSFLDIFQ